MASGLIPLPYFPDIELEAQEGNGLPQGHLIVFNKSLMHIGVPHA